MLCYGDFILLSSKKGSIAAKAVCNGGVDGAVGIGYLLDALCEMGHHRALTSGTAVGRSIEAYDGIFFVEVWDIGLEVI